MRPPPSLGGFTGPAIALPLTPSQIRDVVARQRRAFVVPRRTGHNGLVALYDLEAGEYAALAFVGSCRRFTEADAMALKEDDRRWLRGLPLKGFLLLLACPSPIDAVAAPKPRLYERVDQDWKTW